MMTSSISTPWTSLCPGTHLLCTCEYVCMCGCTYMLFQYYSSCYHFIPCTSNQWCKKRRGIPSGMSFIDLVQQCSLCGYKIFLSGFVIVFFHRLFTSRTTRTLRLSFTSALMSWWCDVMVMWYHPSQCVSIYMLLAYVCYRKKKHPSTCDIYRLWPDYVIHYACQ